MTVVCTHMCTQFTRHINFYDLKKAPYSYDHSNNLFSRVCLVRFYTYTHTRRHRYTQSQTTKPTRTHKQAHTRTCTHINIHTCTHREVCRDTHIHTLDTRTYLVYTSAHLHTMHTGTHAHIHKR